MKVKETLFIFSHHIEFVFRAAGVVEANVFTSVGMDYNICILQHKSAQELTLWPASVLYLKQLEEHEKKSTLLVPQNESQ